MPWILATDATPTTGRIALMKYDDNYFVIGNEHPFDKPTKINLNNNGQSNPLLPDGTVNGLELFPKLKEFKAVSEASLINAFILVPLCENSFHYSVGTFPLGKGFTAAELQFSFLKVVKVAKAAMPTV